MKSKKAAIFAFLLIFLGLSALFVYARFTLVGSGFSRVVCRTDAESLDLSEFDLTSLAGIERCEKLRELDARGLELTGEDIDRVNAALPECEVLWSVPFSSGAADSSSKKLILPDADASDLELIKYMTELEFLDLGACALYEEIFALRQELECEMMWRVQIGEDTYTCDTAELTLGDVDAQEAAKLRWLPALANVDARGCSAYDALIEAQTYLPECSILWQYEFMGKTALNTDTVLDLSGIAIEDADAFADELGKALAYMPSVNKIEMIRCGLSNEQMAALGEKYPDIKFVWMVTFGPDGNKYTVRTDITCFSTLLGSSRKGSGNEKDYENLFLYCTDLVALDMGHNALEDISLMANLTKLQMLILTDNLIKDISPLTACKELFFLEMNKNRVADAAPLAQMESIKYVTLHYNKIEDASPLYGFDKLKILVLSENFGIPKAQKTELAESIPDCSVYFELPFGTGTGAQWDALPERQAVKHAFTNWARIREFRSWDDIEWI